MRESIELMQTAYDRIAGGYDEQTIHLREMQRRMTEALALEPGLTCVDIGCGTGLETLEMLKRVSPGEVVGVDCSEQMLAAARRRARDAGLELTTRCETAEEFIQASDDARFDVLTLRFCLGYLDYRAILPRLPRLLRAGGRIGLLAHLGSSAHQAYATYRRMVADLRLPDVALTAPDSREAIEERLEAGGAVIDDSYTHTFRLWFDSGMEVASWLRESGLAAHPALERLAPSIVDALWRGFADRFEEHREPRGLPLDFAVAAVIARCDALPGERGALVS